MQLLAKGFSLRVEFDESWAWGYFDIPIPNWVLRLLRLRWQIDNYNERGD